ncbi:MAG: hypothetical protein HOM11_16250 [Methylococcales bacterium]|jgi:hypothetical protein|nr:hypothetical protein [Methylococcales bacterium]MBT7443878.1 hypothetical protein [Methylococcales bacterium]
MSVLLFRLKDVPEEEIEGVVALLEANHFETFETSAGRWGISIAAIWLKNNEDYPRARALLDEFQSTHVREVQAAYQSGLQAGDVETFWYRYWRMPIQMMLYFIVIAFIAYFSLKPFFSMVSTPEEAKKSAVEVRDEDQ